MGAHTQGVSPEERQAEDDREDDTRHRAFVRFLIARQAVRRQRQRVLMRRG